MCKNNSLNDCISITLSFCVSCYHKLNCDHRIYQPNFIIIKDIKKQTYIHFIVKSILSDCGIAICRVFSFTKSWPLGLNQIAYIYSLKKKLHILWRLLTGLQWWHHPSDPYHGEDTSQRPYMCPSQCLQIFGKEMVIISCVLLSIAVHC